MSRLSELLRQVESEDQQLAADLRREFDERKPQNRDSHYLTVIPIPIPIPK